MMELRRLNTMKTKQPTQNTISKARIRTHLINSNSWRKLKVVSWSQGQKALDIKVTKQTINFTFPKVTIRKCSRFLSQRNTSSVIQWRVHQIIHQWTLKTRRTILSNILRMLQWWTSTKEKSMMLNTSNSCRKNQAFKTLSKKTSRQIKWWSKKLTKNRFKKTCNKLMTTTSKKLSMFLKHSRLRRSFLFWVKVKRKSWTHTFSPSITSLVFLSWCWIDLLFIFSSLRILTLSVYETTNWSSCKFFKSQRRSSARRLKLNSSK